MAARLGGNNTSPQGGRGGAEGRGRGRGPARGRGGYDRQRQNDGPDASLDTESSNVSRGDSGNRGRGGYRGRGGRGGDDRRPARHEYERRDASGRGCEFRWFSLTASVLLLITAGSEKVSLCKQCVMCRNEIEKKHGAGRGNWGDQREELAG